MIAQPIGLIWVDNFRRLSCRTDSFSNPAAWLLVSRPAKTSFNTSARRCSLRPKRIASPSMG
jgi:hypothetical protein